MSHRSSACTRQYESDVLPARQLGQIVPPSPFSEKQQRQSRYDGLPELDGRSTRPLVEVSASEPLAHIARENRAAAHGNRLPRHHYTEIPLTGCQLSTTPYYQLPQSFMSPFPLSVEGELLDSGALQLAGMPWEFKAGVLVAFVQMSGDRASSSISSIPRARSSWAYFGSSTATRRRTIGPKVSRADCLALIGPRSL